MQLDITDEVMVSLTLARASSIDTKILETRKRLKTISVYGANLQNLVELT